MKLLLFSLLFFSIPSIAQAEINSNLAHRAIIGEAAGESFEGKVAVGEAIRNRGSLKGVYGLNAKHVDKEPEWVWRHAREAWEASKHSNLVSGADHWESVKFPVPYWAKTMIMTAHIGNHKFYRRAK